MHIVRIRADGTTSAPEHAEVRDCHGKPVFGLPGQMFGTTDPGHAPSTPGTYRLWAVLIRANGQVITITCTVNRWPSDLATSRAVELLDLALAKKLPRRR